METAYFSETWHVGLPTNLNGTETKTSSSSSSSLATCLQFVQFLQRGRRTTGVSVGRDLTYLKTSDKRGVHRSTASEGHCERRIQQCAWVGYVTSFVERGGSLPDLSLLSGVLQQQDISSPPLFTPTETGRTRLQTEASSYWKQNH